MIDGIKRSKKFFFNEALLFKISPYTACIMEYGEGALTGHVITVLGFPFGWGISLLTL